MPKNIEDAVKILIKDFNTFVAENNLSEFNKEFHVKNCLTETWFSDTLAWLLNPKESHPFGVNFANEFIKRVAVNRSGKSKNCNNFEYQRREAFLRFGDQKPGQLPSKFNLGNSAVIREFYLSKSIKKKDNRDGRFCDLVLFDLDKKDGLFLVVENKLFTTNHNGQLEDYYSAVEEKFHNVKVREYVYLTLNADSPVNIKPNAAKQWVKVSWLKDILDILEKLYKDNSNYDINKLIHILKWMRTIHDLSINHESNPVPELNPISLGNGIRSSLCETVAECMVEELNRLGVADNKWKIKRIGKRISISHQSLSQKQLYVELLSNLTVTIQSKIHGDEVYDKIILPFGANSDQVYNLFDIAARDIYHFSFNESLNKQLSNNKRQDKSKSAMKQKYLHFFNLVYKNADLIRVIITMTNMQVKPES